MLFLESPPQITSLSTKFMHEGGGVLQLDKYQSIHSGIHTSDNSKQLSNISSVSILKKLPWPNYFFMFSAARPGVVVRAGGRRRRRTVDTDLHWACSSALNRIRWRAIFLHRVFQRLHRNRLTLHQPPLVEENLNRSPSRLEPVDGSCGAANTNFCKQLLGYSRVSAAEELRGRGC